MAVVFVLSIALSSSFAGITSKKQLVVEVLKGDRSGRMITLRAGLHDALSYLDEGKSVDYVMDYASESGTYEQMSDEMKSQLRSSFEEYKNGTHLNPTRKKLVKDAILTIKIYDDEEDEEIYDKLVTTSEISNFPNIAKEINDYLIGIPSNNDGVKLMLALMKFMAKKSGQPIAYSTETGLLDLGIYEYSDMKIAMDYFINAFYRKDSTLQSMFSELENTVNNKTLEERTKFYSFLTMANTYPAIDVRIFGTPTVPVPVVMLPAVPSSSASFSPDPIAPTIAPTSTPILTEKGEKLPAGGSDFLAIASRNIETSKDSDSVLQELKDMAEVLGDKPKFSDEEQTQLIDLLELAMQKANTIETLGGITTLQIQNLLKNIKESQDISKKLVQYINIDNKIHIADTDTKRTEGVHFPVEALNLLNSSQTAIEYESFPVSFTLPSEKIHIPAESKVIELKGRILEQDESLTYTKDPKSVIVELKAIFDGKVAEAQEFTENKDITVNIYRQLPDGENPNDYTVYYLKKVGDSYIKELVKPQYYIPNTGVFTFKLAHFSDYLIEKKVVLFKDIEKYSWAEEQIGSLASKGIISGITEDTFGPEMKVTRAQFATLLVKTFGILDEKAEGSFGDTPKDAWYYRAVASAVKVGIAKGRSDGNFAPNESISRADMAVMINNAGKTLKLKAFLQPIKASHKYADDQSIPDYAREAINYTTMLGIFKGYTGDFFNAKLKAVRAEAAVVIYKLFNME